MTNEQKYIILVRLYLNDTEELNRLIRMEESDDDKILLAISMTLSDWQTSDPYMRDYTCDNFPSMRLLIYGACIELLRSAGIYHSRNHLTYNAGGLSVEIHSKASEYMQWITQFKQDYELGKRDLLRRMNINSAWSGGARGVHSDYILAGMGSFLEAYA